VPCLLLTYPYSRYLVLFFHSNAEDLGRCYSFCRLLREKFQVHVLAVEYPGYGLCPGVATGKTVMENSFSALHFATQSLHWPVDSILTFGRSIGTGPAVKLASLFRFAGVILVTPFLSIADLFKDRVGPLSSLFEDWYPNIDLAPRIKCPVLLIHGKADNMIGFHHAELLYTAISTRKLLVSPSALSHNTNLMNDVSYLILPATHFFSLPDYVFHDLQVPQWAFDEERATSRRPAWSTLIQREGKALLQLGHQFTARPSGGKMPSASVPCCGSGQAASSLWPSIGCCSRASVDQHEAAETVQVGYDLDTLHLREPKSQDPCHAWSDPVQPIAVSLPARHKEFQEEEEIAPHMNGVRWREKLTAISV